MIISKIDYEITLDNLLNTLEFYKGSSEPETLTIEILEPFSFEFEFNQLKYLHFEQDILKLKVKSFEIDRGIVTIKLGEFESATEEIGEFEKSWLRSQADAISKII